MYPPRLDEADAIEAEAMYEEVQAARPRNAKQTDDVQSWTLDIADKCWKLSGTVRLELMQTRMISLLVEWCETEDQRSASVCYDDVCFVHDSPASEI